MDRYMKGLGSMGGRKVVAFVMSEYFDGIGFSYAMNFSMLGHSQVTFDPPIADNRMVLGSYRK